MTELHFPWLELSITIPLLASIPMMLMSNRDRARTLCILACSLAMICALGEWIDFITLNTFEAHDHWDIVNTLFDQDIFVVDELSAPLLPLAALLYLMTVLSTLKTKVNRFSFGWTLLSEAILLATFSCRSGWPLIALLVLSTIPPWRELKYRRKETTRVYSLYMGLFIVSLVAGYALLPDAQNSRSSSDAAGIVAVALLTFAALIRSGVAPFHTWVTDLFDRATFGTALLIMAPMPGAYIVMRIILPIAPTWTLQSIAIVSLVSSVYSAAMSLVQKDSRRFFCFLFLSHSSLVLVGLELVTPIGLTGALCVWASAALSLSGLGLTLRAIEARKGRVSLSEFHGLYEHAPTLAAFFLLTGLASIGFPGTIGFVGTELLIEGAVTVYPLIGTAVVVAAALNGIAILHAYFRVFTGTRHTASISLRARLPERIAVLVLMALIIGGGLYPQPGVASRHHAASALIEQRNGGQPTHQAASTHSLALIDTERHHDQ